MSGKDWNACSNLLEEEEAGDIEGIVRNINVVVHAIMMLGCVKDYLIFHVHLLSFMCHIQLLLLDMFSMLYTISRVCLKNS